MFVSFFGRNRENFFLAHLKIGGKVWFLRAAVKAAADKVAAVKAAAGKVAAVKAAAGKVAAVNSNSF